MLKDLKAKRLIFTITPGRSGTGLLTSLLRECLGIDAQHEPVPRLNYVMRSLIYAPELTIQWLKSEKFPKILENFKNDIYVETSHLFCKGFIEPTLQLGIRPDFIILYRPTREVAKSLYQINAIPERTSAGKLVLLGPTDPGVLTLPNWKDFSDYQLCYWYACEIERRQNEYEQNLPKQYGVKTYRINMDSLLDWDSFVNLSKFIIGKSDISPSKEKYLEIISKNQNPRSEISKLSQDRVLPINLDDEEEKIKIAMGLINV